MAVTREKKQGSSPAEFFENAGSVVSAAATAQADANANQNPKKYCPHAPWPKQQAFLGLNCKEAFYGGAAGGGKSDALLMAALQYVHVPGYSAIILRKDTRRLELSGGLIPRSHHWLAGTGAKWNGSQRRWTFSTSGSPATLSFGYLLDSLDKYRYGSSEYQYIGFDELTEFAEEDYLFLFSRLRKTVDLAVPLRVRSASNPGNIGHLWVKNRFIGDGSTSDVSPSASGLQPGSDDVLWREGRAYIPARIGDNPALNETEYRDSLSHLPPLLRERLMNGDWSVREEGLIRPEWLRYYTVEGGQLLLRDRDGGTLTAVDEQSGRRFATIDPAGTSADRARERRGRPASYTVLQVWQQVGDDAIQSLVLREQWRERVGFDGLCRLIEQAHNQWHPGKIWIENDKLGQATVDLLGRKLPVQCIATQGRDKVARAAPLISKLERGEVYLPKHAPWRAELEAEWLAWSGDPEEPADQIDAAAYAAQLALSGGPLKLSMLPVFHR
jgi:predicted phage terminase large subunit-like protein